MTDEFRDAERGAAKPLLGLYAQSGCGKTYGSLLVARGFVGPKGRIGMIETESGRGEAFAKPQEYPEFAGDGQAANYKVKSLHDDFSPKAYGDAIAAAEKAKFDALIVDSGSHEWEGPGGVLDLAAKNQADGVKGVLVWQQPKIKHKKDFMLKLMQTPIPLVILCLRAKYPMEKKGSDWVRSAELEPIQAEDILFEMFVHGWIDHEHKFHRTKISTRSLEPVFPDNEMLSLETGKRLRAWADGAEVEKAKSRTYVPLTAGDMDELEREGHEAVEGGVSVVNAWAERIRKDFWDRATKEQRSKLSALKTELLDKAEKAANESAE